MAAEAYRTAYRRCSQDIQRDSGGRLDWRWMWRSDRGHCGGRGRGEPGEGYVGSRVGHAGSCVTRHRCPSLRGRKQGGGFHDAIGTIGRECTQDDKAQYKQIMSIIFVRSRYDRLFELSLSKYLYWVCICPSASTALTCSWFSSVDTLSSGNATLIHKCQLNYNNSPFL